LQDRSEPQKDESSSEVPFFPNVLLAEVSLAVAVIGILAIFVSLFPLKLGERFDPFNPPSILEPEWYFMAMYQFLKTESIQPIHGMLLGAGLGVFLVLIPFLDKSPEREPLRRPIFTAIALFAASEFLGLMIYGYLSPGQVGSFSETNFVAGFLTTNLVALGLVALVFALHRRKFRSAKR